LIAKLLEMFRQDAMINVLAGTAIVAAICSYVGVFIVLRRAVFVCAALVQVSSLGMALALFVGGLASVQQLHSEARVAPQPFALVLTIAASVLMALQHRERRLPRETWIGVAYAGALALAFLVVTVSARAGSEVLNLLFGNLLAIDNVEVVGLGAMAINVGLVHGFFYKEFLFVSFDPDMATAIGVRARLWNMLLFLTIGVTISLAIRAAGALVVFSFLVLPAATALLFGRSLRMAFILSVILGVISSFVGIALSYVGDLPSGPTIVAVSTVFFLFAGLINLFRR
jgi:ABC-type Mn2+/Zn2+ transport system permease subunit